MWCINYNRFNCDYLKYIFNNLQKIKLILVPFSDSERDVNS